MSDQPLIIVVVADESDLDRLSSDAKTAIELLRRELSLQSIDEAGGSPPSPLELALGAVATELAKSSSVGGASAASSPAEGSELREELARDADRVRRLDAVTFPIPLPDPCPTQEVAVTPPPPTLARIVLVRSR